MQYTIPLPNRVCLITLRNSLRPPEYVRVVQAYAASANAVTDAELYKSSTANLVRNTINLIN